MNKTFIVDIDETVLAYSDVFQYWMESRGFKSHKRLRNIYCVAETFNISDEDAVQKILEFYETDLFGELPAEPDAKIVLDDLYHRGFDFVAVSAAPESTVEKRLKNLEAEFGFDWEAHCVGLRASKKATLESIPATYYAEDHVGHAEVGASIGLKTFLITRNYNNSDISNNFVRVDDWFQIRELIDSEELK